MSIRSERIEFAGSQGQQLAARLDRPTREPDAWAVFAHCFTCGKDIAAVARIATALARRGLAVQRAQLLDIARRCPVHRTLLGEKEMLVRMA